MLKRTKKDNGPLTVTSNSFRIHRIAGSKVIHEVGLAIYLLIFTLFNVDN